MKKKIFFIIAVSLLLCNINCNHEKEEQLHLNQQDAFELNFILDKWASAFVNKIDKDYRIIVNFTIPEDSVACHLNIENQKYNLAKGKNDQAAFTFQSSNEHYNKIYREEMTALTSLGRANMSDKTPLDFKFNQPYTDALMDDFLFFVQRFFHQSNYDKVVLERDNSRIVHGGHAIPIFYRKNDEIGVRSAWYQINRGQQVNEPGDTNPFPQYFIITKGWGFAKIGNDTLPVIENEAYYVPPGSDHVFWTNSVTPMEMIFLAWGKGA